MKFDCCGGVGWHAPYCQNEPHEPSLYDIATEQENVAFLALAFARSWAHWRHAQDVSVFGALTSRISYPRIGLDERDVLRVEVRRVSGGLLRV